MKPRLTTLLVVGLMTSGCLQLTGPIPDPPAERTSASRQPADVQRPLHLSTRVEVRPKLVVVGFGVPGSAIIIDMHLTNHEDRQVVLTDAYLDLVIRDSHGYSPFPSSPWRTTFVLAPGQTWSRRLELPSTAIEAGLYHIRMSVQGDGYRFQSPTEILRVIRYQKIRKTD